MLFLAMVASADAGQYARADEAKAMLDRAVAAVKEVEAKALDMFHKGEGGFKDRDLYVLCTYCAPIHQTASSQRIQPLRVGSSRAFHSDHR